MPELRRIRWRRPSELRIASDVYDWLVEILEQLGIHVWAPSVLGWGMGGHGAVGHNQVTDSLVPTWVDVPEAWAVSADIYHSLAITQDGDVWLWGSAAGLCGTSATHPAPWLKPVRVTLLPSSVGRVRDAAAIFAASFFCTEDGKVLACGGNFGGELGQPHANVPYTNTPLEVPGLSSATAVKAGNSFAVARRADGSVWSWGKNDAGQLGDGTTTSRSVPYSVPGLAQVEAISCGFSHSLGLLANRTVVAWGANWSGQMGFPPGPFFATPTDVPGLTDVVAIAAGYDHNAAVRADGSVWTWGRNDRGQLGDGTTTDRSVPSPVPGLSGVQQVACGWGHTIAVVGQNLFAWGENDYGQLGDGTRTNRHTPTQVLVPQPLAHATVSAGWKHSLAATAPPPAWMQV